MDKESKFIFRKIIFDFISLGIVSFPLLLYKLFGEPYKRGFFCDDESIRHPYHDSTITSLALYFIGFGFPIVVILCTEVLRASKHKDNREHKVLAGRNIPPWVWECYKVIGVFCFGAASSQLTTDISKYVVGRLRPHFIDICKPNVNCSLAENLHRYIEDFECLGTRRNRIHDARLSFMSGHSSFSAYTMFFLILYVQSRWSWRGSKLLRHLLQYVAFSFAFYTALSRISDYKHHWSDVLTGSIQGITFAFLIVFCVSELFSKRSRNLNAETVLPIAMEERKPQIEINDH